MKYQTTNELEHFEFKEAFIEEIVQMNGYFYMNLANVTILPENTCNRDIRKMRTNDLVFQIPDGRILTFVEEGYQVFDANGSFVKKQDDIVLTEDVYLDMLKNLQEGSIYSIEKKSDCYEIFVDTEEHTYFLKVEGTHDVEKWDRFLNLEQA